MGTRFNLGIFQGVSKGSFSGSAEGIDMNDD